MAATPLGSSESENESSGHDSMLTRWWSELRTCLLGFQCQERERDRPRPQSARVRYNAQDGQTVNTKSAAVIIRDGMQVVKTMC